MSGGVGKGGLWVAVLIVLAVLGVAAWFTIGGGTAAYDSQPGGHTIGKQPAETPEAPVFQAPVAPEPEPLNAKPSPDAGHAPALVPTPPALPPVSSSKVVARGHVLWAGGKVPLESDVKLYDAEASDIDFTSTDENGAFELSSEDPLEEGWSFGTDPIDVTFKGESATLLPALVANLPAHEVGDPPVERDLVLGFGPVLSGRVIDAATKVPIEGAEVHVVCTYAPFALDELMADTGADGRYELPLENVPLQGLIVWCRADEYQVQLAGPLDLKPVPAPGDTATQDFAMAPAMIVHGHVTDGRTRQPVDGATITVGSRFTALAGESNFDFTDDTGVFELESSEIPVEGGWLIVSSPTFAPELVPLAKGTEFLEIVLGAPFTLAGTVLDKAGHGVPNARVQVAFDGDTPDLDQQIGDQADCDKDGRFETTLELVPDRNALLRVDLLDKRPYRARLTDVGRLLPGNRWEVELRLADR